MSDKPDSAPAADTWLYRLTVAGLVMLLAGLVACAVWPWVVGGVTR